MNETRGLWRGKSADNNGKWIEGDLTSNGNGEQEYFITDRPTHWTYKVVTETLGECTGLTDKNDKLIFEGDIIKIDKATIVRFEGRYGVVKWLNDDVSFALVFGHQWLFWNDHIFEENCEIIGNIHDNPGLLNGIEESEET